MIFETFKIFQTSQIAEMPPVNLEDMFRENETPVEGFVDTGFEKVCFLLIKASKSFFYQGFKKVVGLIWLKWATQITEKYNFTMYKA